MATLGKTLIPGIVACLACSTGSATLNDAQGPPAAPLAAPNPAVDVLFAAWDRPEGTPGCALGAVRDGQLVYSRGYGMADIEHDAPNTPATAFHVASLSKQFTAMAIHLLEQEGRLSLDDPVGKHLPELHDFGSPLTIRHLLNHTSGLRDQWALLNLAGWRQQDVITERDILDLVWRQTSLNFPPGEGFLYSNTGYTLLAVIVGRVSGQPLPEFAEQRIFEPLGMHHTHFHDRHGALVKGRAYSYVPRGADRYEQMALNYSNVGATSLFTTVEDLARWDANFRSGTVGGPELLSRMQIAGRLNDGRRLDYASGLELGRYRGLPVVEHSGGDAGFRAHMMRFPEQRFSAIVLCNAGEADPTLLARQVADLYLQGQLGPEPAKPASARRAKDDAAPPPELPPERLAAYAGAYFSPELGVLYFLTVRDGRLYLRHPRGETPLRPAGKDSFAGRYPVDNVRFRCSAKDRCEGFGISNGRVLNLQFDKVELHSSSRDRWAAQ